MFLSRPLPFSSLADRSRPSNRTQRFIAPSDPQWFSRTSTPPLLYRTSARPPSSGFSTATGAVGDHFGDPLEYIVPNRQSSDT